MPHEETSSNFLDGKNPYDGCRKFNATYAPDIGAPLSPQFDQCDANFYSNETVPCDEYIFDDFYFDETLSTKLDLVCENEYKKNLLATILILGLLFGSFIGGLVGDKFGRKKAFLLAILLTVPSTIIAGHVNSYEGKQLMHTL